MSLFKRVRGDNMTQSERGVESVAGTARLAWLHDKESSAFLLSEDLRHQLFRGAESVKCHVSWRGRDAQFVLRRND